VSKLQNRLNVLQRNLLKNELDAKDIKTQAENVKDSAGNAHELATQVKINVFLHKFRVFCLFCEFAA
jgi:hypothetical protein